MFTLTPFEDWFEEDLKGSPVRVTASFEVEVWVETFVGSGARLDRVSIVLACKIVLVRFGVAGVGPISRHYARPRVERERTNNAEIVRDPLRASTLAPRQPATQYFKVDERRGAHLENTRSWQT